MIINPYRYASVSPSIYTYEWLATSISQGDETNISTWTDEVAGKTFDQATGTKQPLFDTSLGGENAVKFAESAGGDWMSSTQNSSFTLTGDFELWVRVYIASDTTMYVLSCNNVEINDGYRLSFNKTTNKMNFVHDGLGIDISSPAISLSTWYDIKISRSGSTITIYEGANAGDTASNSSDLTCANDMYFGVKSWTEDATTMLQDGSGVSILRWK